MMSGIVTLFCFSIILVVGLYLINLEPSKPSDWRIKKKIYCNDNIKYTIESKYGIIWFAYYKSFDNIVDCQKEIDKQVARYLSNKVVKTLIIKNDDYTVFIKGTK